MRKVCAYIVNEAPFFMQMAASSIISLREHSDDHVRVFLIEDEGKTTATNGREYNIDMTKDSKECRKRFDEVVGKLNVDIQPRKAKPYVHLNRIYLSECTEDRVLYIDSDTFIFNKLDPIWEYQPLAVTKGYFHIGAGWDSNWFPMPLSSAVMLWNQEGLKSWTKELPDLIERLNNHDDPISKWVQTKGGNQISEEIALTCWAINHKANYTFFNEQHVCNVDHQHFWKSNIAHTFSYAWEQVRQMLGRKLPL